MGKIIFGLIFFCSRALTFYWYNWYNWYNLLVFWGFAGVFLLVKSPLLLVKWQKMAVVWAVAGFRPIRCGFFCQVFLAVGIDAGGVFFPGVCAGIKTGLADYVWSVAGGVWVVLVGLVLLGWLARWARLGDGAAVTGAGWFFSACASPQGGVATVSFQVGITKTCVVGALTNTTNKTLAIKGFALSTPV